MVLHRPTARVLLACYSLIALCGQGLHTLVDDDCCDSAPVVAASATVESASQLPNAADVLSGVVHSGSGSHEHDCEHCAICKFHAAGQHFVAPVLTHVDLTACEILSPPAFEPVHCPALFSPAQPRAPPVAV
jgi:hypothetical protein